MIEPASAIPGECRSRHFENIRLSSNTSLLLFDTQKNLASSFLRFQEHYESPKFRGKIFSIDEYKKWYIKNTKYGQKTGKFTYYTDWAGFNIPSAIFAPFIEGKFDPLSRQERAILESIGTERVRAKYVIGASIDSTRLVPVMQHEIAHSLFYTDPAYKEKVLDLIPKFNLERARASVLDGAGYDPVMLDDELQAYSLSGSKNVDPGFSATIQKLYAKHCKQDLYPKFRRFCKITPSVSRQ